MQANNIIDECKKYMFDNTNINRFTNDITNENIKQHNKNTNANTNANAYAKNNTNTNAYTKNNGYAKNNTYLKTNVKNQQHIQPTNVTNITNVTNVTNVTNITNKKKDFYIPSATQDTLFWCFYIMKNSFISYEMLNQKNLVGEKKIKIDYVDVVRKNKELLKKYKFTSLMNLENVLANEPKIDTGTFFSLCVLENMNVLFIKNKTYFELLMNDTQDIFVVRNINNRYGYEESTLSNINKWKEGLIKIDNVEKPLKSPSSYKVDDLIAMCTKLELDIKNKETTKTKTKKDLYDMLFTYF